MQITPYLHFNGKCEEAIEFYKKAIGAQVTSLMRFKENPEPSANPPGSAEKIMHASLRVGDTTIMASDGHERFQGKPNFQGFAAAGKNLLQSEFWNGFRSLRRDVDGDHSHDVSA